MIGKSLLNRTSRTVLATMLLVAQMLPFFAFQVEKASAAGQITFGSQFENQVNANDPNIWATGQLDNYSEGDYINFRFTMTATQASGAGTMQIEFDKGSCNFFTSYFNVASVTPAIASVTKGTQSSTSQMYVQSLNVAFTSAGTTTVIFTLQLSNTAGECNGSNTGVRLAVPDDKQNTQIDENGDFDNVGAKTLPISANSVLENPSLTITKTVVGGTALPSDFSFSVSPAINGQTTVSIPAGQNSVTINEVNPDGAYVITENGPAGYSFTSGSGTSCSVTSLVQGKMTATLVASTSSPTNATCNFTNEIQKGSIKIVKDAKPNRAQDFSFTATGTGVQNFSLDDDSNETLPNNAVFSNLNAGQYSFTENAVEGWYLKDIVCTGADVVKSGSTVSVTLDPGENAVCTYTNVKKATITVQKVTNPGSDPTLFPVSISGSGTIYGQTSSNISTSQPASFNVSEGAYSVAETVPSGWTQISNTCTTNNLTFAPVTNTTTEDELNKTCTISNTKYAKLTIIKDAVSNSLQDFTFNATNLGTASFLLDDDAGVSGADSTNSNSREFTQLLPGTTYNVTELGVDNWVLTGISCSEGLTVDLKYATVSWSPQAGQTATCTFTNTQLGSIGGTKWLVNADGSLTDEEVLVGWVIDLLDEEGEVIDSTQTDDNGAYLFSGLLPGTYLVAEQQDQSYTQIYETELCPSATYLLSLAAGINATSYDFCNFENGSISGYKWHDADGDQTSSGEQKLSGWQIFIDGNDNENYDNGELTTMTNQDGNYSFTNLAPGTYVVCEVQQAGWDQTFPSATKCHSVSIDQSGESNTYRNFGNRAYGTLRVEKDVINDNGGKLDYSDFSFSVNGGTSQDFESTSEYDGAKEIRVPVGYYDVSEPEEDSLGYETTYSNCTEVQVVVNQTASCKITNDDTAASVTLIKEVVDEYNGPLDAEDFTLTLTKDQSTTNTSTGETLSVDAGEYVAGEVQEDGYEAGAWTGDCAADGSLTVEMGESYTCTITNTAQPATIRVHKTVVNDDGGEKTASAFSFYIDDVKGTHDFTGDGLESTVTLELPAGTYTVTENEHDDYTASYEDCENITAKNGEVYDCYITNDDIAPRVYVTKYIADDCGYDSRTSFSENYWCEENEQLFGFNLKNNGEQYANFSLSDGGQYSTENGLKAGRVVITEQVTENWHLVYENCYYYDGQSESRIYVGTEFDADIGKVYFCEFVNEEAATIIVTKYHDIDEDGEWDEGEPTLPEWEMTLDTENICEEPARLDAVRTLQVLEDGCESDEISNQMTDEDGDAYFTDLYPGWYKAGEVMQSDWKQSSIVCENEWNEVILYNLFVENHEEGDSSSVYVRAGETAHCYVGNYRKPAIDIVKFNDTTAPVPRGTTITFTIKVTVPVATQSGAVYGAFDEAEKYFPVTVFDEFTNEFQYIVGSYTAQSSIRGDLKAQGIVADPNYASTASWSLTSPESNVMIPGEVVTLTYKGVVESTAPAGVYNTIAKVTGYGDTFDEVVTDTDPDSASVYVPAVLAAVTTKKLVSTGTYIAGSIFVGMIIVITTLVLLTKRNETI